MFSAGLAFLRRVCDEIGDWDKGWKDFALSASRIYGGVIVAPKLLISARKPDATHACSATNTWGVVRSCCFGECGARMGVGWEGARHTS